MGGRAESTSAPRINNLAVQTSAYGLPISRGWGRARIKCNLVWFGDFQSQSHKQKEGGKGGAPTNTTYTYTASVIMGLCHGPISDVITVYRDSSVYTSGSSSALAQARLSFATGAIGQSTWPYLTSSFPSEAIGYSGLAYVYAQDYSLTDSAALQNHSFEVNFGTQLSSTVFDADPSVIISDVFSEVPGWPVGLLASFINYQNYTLSVGLLLSPALEDTKSAADFVDDVMKCTNSEIVWSEGVVKIVPYGDTAATGNGKTYTPNLSPIYDLDESDFLPMEGDDGPPVEQNIVDQSDAYNIVQIEYLNRANQYNTAIQPAQDLDDIIEHGKRKEDPTSLHHICDSAVAVKVANLRLQRVLYVREMFKFRLPEDFVLLECMDLVTLTTLTDQLKLNRRLVRIKQIEEDQEGTLTMTAEGLDVGIANAALYAAHVSGGYSASKSVAPGAVTTPFLFNGPMELTNGAAEVWMAVSSTSPTWGGAEVWVATDGDYTRVGFVHARARYGISTSEIDAVADPDSTSTVGVDLSSTLGGIDGGTQLDVDAAATLFLLDGELMSYRDSDLTGVNTYDLSYFRRGLYGTPVSSHPSGSEFVRLDDTIFRYPYGNQSIGTTIQVKLLSFNIFQLAKQTLDDVTAYPFVLEPTPPRISNLHQVDDTADDIVLQWDVAPGADSYSVRFYAGDDDAFKRSFLVNSNSVTYTSAQRTADGSETGYYAFVSAMNGAGSGPSTGIVVGTVVGGGSSGGGSGGTSPPAPTATIRKYGVRSFIATCSAIAGSTGYAFYIGDYSGFTPTGAPFRSGPSTNIGPISTSYDEVYLKAAAYNASWDGDPAHLNFSIEVYAEMDTPSDRFL